MSADVIETAQVPLPVDEPKVVFTAHTVESNAKAAPGSPMPPYTSGDDIKASTLKVAEVVTSTSLVPVDYERQLDPRSISEAKTLATWMFESRMFSAYGTPQAVLSTVILGRELGMPMMASLRAVHIIEGKHSLSAAAMVALVLKSGLAEYFEPVEFDGLHATFETHRKGARKPVVVTHTLEMAKLAGLVKPGSGYVKNPTDQLVARCQSRLARMVYPDLLGGFYSPEELRDAREEGKAA